MRILGKALIVVAVALIMSGCRVSLPWGEYDCTQMDGGLWNCVQVQ